LIKRGAAGVIPQNAPSRQGRVKKFFTGSLINLLKDERFLNLNRANNPNGNRSAPLIGLADSHGNNTSGWNRQTAQNRSRRISIGPYSNLLASC
jgi:hypothetical protein